MVNGGNTGQYYGVLCQRDRDREKTDRERKAKQATIICKVAHHVRR